MRELNFDNVVLPKMKVTKEGFLKGDVVATRTGVFWYETKDGKVEGVLRPPEEVFKNESLESLKGLPILYGHPDYMVNVDTITEHVVGYTGDNVRIDKDKVIINATITRPDAIEAIKNGLKGVSLGYYSLNIDQEGEYEGEKYTSIQTNIDYNHLAAAIAAGRAGPEARINLSFDKKPDNLNFKINKGNIMTDQEKDVNLQSTTDSIESKIDKLGTDLETKIENEINKSMSMDSRNKKIDELAEENKRLKAELENQKKANYDSLLAQKEDVNRRVNLLIKIQPYINLDSAKDMGNREIMEKVISTIDSNLNFDKKSDDFVEGIFEGLVTIHKAPKENSGESNGFFQQALAGTMDSTTTNFTRKFSDIEAREKVLDIYRSHSGK
jgi:uncharacterized protein